MLLGLIRPTSGTGTVLGHPLTDPAAYLGSVGALIEAPAFYPNLSGRANLVTLARLGRINVASVDPVIERVGLAGRATDLYRTYSLGMKQRLGIAASLLVEPTLLILDEPANDLDPAGIVETRRLMRSLADDGITIFVSSHLLAEIEQVCDFFVMIQAGQLVFQGSAESLFANQTAELLARPEDTRDLETLAGAVRSTGRVARVEDGTLVVDAEATWAAELNRVAISAGITLAHLSERRRSLEEAFFKLTGSSGADTLSPVDKRRAS
jgi:ABC-2 type transport system ATP-binding protein